MCKKYDAFCVVLRAKKYACQNYPLSVTDKIIRPGLQFFVQNYPGYLVIGVPFKCMVSLARKEEGLVFRIRIKCEQNSRQVSLRCAI